MILDFPWNVALYSIYKIVFYIDYKACMDTLYYKILYPSRLWDEFLFVLFCVYYEQLLICTKLD